MLEQQLKIHCHVTTNGSQYNAKVEKILSNLPISMTVSIDGATRETFESIRLNSNYTEVMNNVRRFRDYTRRRGTYFGIAFCLMRQNWHEFVDVLLLAEDLECEVFVNTVINPSRCSLFTLSAEDTRRIADKIEKQGHAVKRSLKRNRHVWEENIQRLRGRSEEGHAGKVSRVLEQYSNLQDHMTRAVVLAEKGLCAEALEETQKVTKNDVQYYRAVALGGTLRRLLGDHEGAESDLKRALKITERKPEAFLYLAELRVDQERFEEALQYARRARELIKEEDRLDAQVTEVLQTISSRLNQSADRYANKGESQG